MSLKKPLVLTAAASLILFGGSGLAGQGSLSGNETALSRGSSGTVRPITLSAPGEYVISPDDLLDISVFDVPEMSKPYRVSPGGLIALPLVQHPVAAAGLTTDQLALAITKRLQTDGLVSDPHVTVDVKESRLHSVTVTGAVKKPQIYPVFGSTTLLDVLAQAEGLADDASGVAVVTHGSAAAEAQESETGRDGSAHSDDVPGAEVIDLKRLMATNDPRLNLELHGGDRVTVQHAGVIYVVGAVNRPGGFVLNSEHQPMTVLKAVALAEDLKPTAVGNKALIVHPKSSGAGDEEDAPVKLNDILAGRAPDEPMHANEILFVPDSKGKQAMRRAAEAAVQITTGVIIWRR
ncbi:MAG TPA: polysaccharide biosynthesis/export family protein [Terriglobia bacterium]